jgi:hypothetical protein
MCGCVLYRMLLNKNRGKKHLQFLFDLKKERRCMYSFTTQIRRCYFFTTKFYYIAFRYLYNIFFIIIGDFIIGLWSLACYTHSMILLLYDFAQSVLIANHACLFLLEFITKTFRQCGWVNIFLLFLSQLQSTISLI